MRSVATLVDHCLDLDAQLLSEWSCRELVESLCEAAQQTRSLHQYTNSTPLYHCLLVARVTAFDVTSTIMLTLQLFTTVDEGIAQLCKVIPSFNQFAVLHTLLLLSSGQRR